jgi:hypothetical protein
MAKSNYVTVVDSATHKPVVGPKMFFTAPAMNKWIKEEKLDEKYPKPGYYIVKELY